MHIPGRLLLVATLCVASLTFVGVAQAAVQLGSVQPGGLTCGGPPDETPAYAQIGSPLTASYTVPSAGGVITSWSTWSNGDAGTAMKLKMFRPDGEGGYLVVGDTGLQTLAGRTGTVSFPTRIAVQAGDVVGMAASNGTTCGNNSSPPAQVVQMTSDDPVGVTSTPMDTTGFAGVNNIAAVLEPDADHDGFGDETQDACPTNASTQGPCSPPQPPAPPAPAPDKQPPTVSSSSRTVHFSKGGSISFLISSSENATGSATGTISLPKHAKVVRFKRATLTLTGGKRTKVTLKLSKRSAKQVRKLLARKAHLKAKVTVTLKDAAGNATTKRLSLKLKR